MRDGKLRGGVVQYSTVVFRRYLGEIIKAARGYPVRDHKGFGTTIAKIVHREDITQIKRLHI